MIRFVLRLALVLALLAVMGLALLYVLPPKNTPFAFPDNTIWKHRQNHSDLVETALAQGFDGVEMDIMFHEGSLRVSHDAGELQASQSLADLLARLEAKRLKPFIWLDIKTMNRADEISIRAELTDLSTRHGLAGRLIVESPRPASMFRLCQVPVDCSIWLQRTGNPWARFQARVLVNALSRWGRVVMVSIDHRRTGNADLIVPVDFPKAYYTYAKHADAEDARRKRGARIYLTD